MSKIWNRLFASLCSLGVAAATAGPAFAAESKYDLQTPRSPIAVEIQDLHVIVMWICVVIFIGVFAVMLYSIINHRKSVGHKAAQFHEHVGVEVAWTVIPLIVLVFMAWPATKTVVKMKDTSAPDLTIKATGYQWKWGYEYLRGEGDLKDVSDGVSFYASLSTPRDQIEGTATKGENYLLETDRHVVVPVGKKVRIITTAADVIHAWWVPALGAKQDAIPGFVRDTWFKADKEGIYRGQCAELCGKDHGFMPIVVEVKSVEDFKKWAGEQKKLAAATADDPNKTYTAEELKARGEKVYAQHCTACHQANGQGIPNTFPALDGSAVVKGAKDAHLDIVANGSKKNPAMAAFGKQLSDVELAAVVTYERNAWGNKSGDMVSPAEAKAARK